MAEKKREEQEGARRVDTGGAAYVGGNVRTGRDFVGRDHVEIHVTGGVTVEQFRDLLAQIRQGLREAGLDPDIAEVIEGDFRVIEEQTKKEKPNKAIVLSKLESISEVLKTTAAAATIATAGVKLAPLMEKAIQWAQQLF